MQPKYLYLLKNERVRRWYENLNAKSYLTATTWLRTLGLYCELENTTPDEILIDTTNLNLGINSPTLLDEWKEKEKLVHISYVLRRF